MATWGRGYTKNGYSFAKIIISSSQVLAVIIFIIILINSNLNSYRLLLRS